MDGKWTKGPWRVKDNRLDGCFDIRGPKDGAGASIFIAEISAVNESEANAKLIAKAPEMAEALIGLLAYLSSRLPDEKSQAFIEAERILREAGAL